MHPPNDPLNMCSKQHSSSQWNTTVSLAELLGTGWQSLTVNRDLSWAPAGYRWHSRGQRWNCCRVSNKSCRKDDRPEDPQSSKAAFLFFSIAASLSEQVESSGGGNLSEDEARCQKQGDNCFRSSGDLFYSLKMDSLGVSSPQAYIRRDIVHI